ncbi:MAG: 50S ribosomal protein L24 [Clostridia bacterium]|nr:50S ribosomal protein L24 [Clostridia bacterium]
MTKSFVKKGDKVLVVTGKDKGKIADVVEVSSKSGKVLVDGVNVVTKHQKPKSQQDKGGIIKKSAPIEASNVMVVCPVCGKATRVAHKELNGKNVRICKKCGATLDKEYVKEAKKEAKKATKATKAKKEDKGE